MGDKKEDEHITIPMPVHETSQLTPSGDAPSTTEPPPRGDAPLPGVNKSTDDLTPERVCLLVVVLILFIPVVPLFLLYALVAYLICNKDVTEDATEETQDDGKAKFYQKLEKFKGTAFHVTKLVSVIHTRIMIGLLTWLAINLSVKSLRKKIILGSHLWKWTLAVVILTCGYPVINMVMSLILKHFKHMCDDRPTVVYFARGLKTSFNLIIFSAMLFLTWHFYFRSSKGLRETTDTDLLFHIVRWSLVSLFIFSICWLIKEALLLKWSFDAIYDRFSKRIRRAGFQLYFLCLISGTTLHIFKPKKEREMVEEKKKEASEDQGRSLNNDSTELKQGKVAAKRRKREIKEQQKIVKDIGKGRKLSEDLMTTYKIKRMVKIFITLVRLSSRGEDDDISDILEEVRTRFPKDHKYANEEELGKLLNLKKDDAKLFYAEIQGEHPGPQNPYEAFKNWTVRAHKNCLALGYTLIDAQRVVDYLNIVMTLSIIAVIICSWLLLIGIATTKLLLLIISPFVATTYIFSDSCKMFLEGVIFAFVRHSYDVGDRCLIDGIEMEVKHINILTTSFLRISGGEETIYPNSVLATKTIVNLKGEPDPYEHIELNLDPTTDESKIAEMEKRMKKFINDRRPAEDPDSYCSVTVKEIGTVIKIDVYFRHIVSDNDVTHFQRFETKNQQRSQLLREIKKILKDLDITTA
ncbi:hypothetical protein Ancab_012456 [Ancistrocladus abbreviatus]